MRSATRVTTDHDEIRRWAEAKNGKPALVKGPDSGDGTGMLRIDFPDGAGDDQLDPISWDDWFDRFEKSSLVFLYQERKASGEDSRFIKLLARRWGDQRL